MGAQGYDRHSLARQQKQHARAAMSEQDIKTAEQWWKDHEHDWYLYTFWPRMILAEAKIKE